MKEPQIRIVQFNSLLKGGGTDNCAIGIARNLARLGHRVCIAGPDGRECVPAVRKCGLELRPVPAGGIPVITQARSLSRILEKEGAQILVAHHGRDYWPAITAAGLGSIRPKVVLCRHLAKSPQTWASRRFLLGRCDAMVAVSEFVAHVLREGASEPGSPEPERRHRPPMRGDLSKIRVIHDGFDMERFVPLESSPVRGEWGIGPRDYVFGVVGGYPLPRGKGQREFLQAAARIHAKHPGARFLVIGRGNMRDILESDIERLGLRGKAILTRYYDPAEMPGVMNALDCLVHPNMGTEAFPGVIIEAQACGKPVITTALDGNPEALAVTGNGQVIPRESVEELAAAMDSWAGRPAGSMADRLGMHRLVAGRFSEAAAARKYEALFQSLLYGERPAGAGNSTGAHDESA